MEKMPETCYLSERERGVAEKLLEGIDVNLTKDLQKNATETMIEKQSGITRRKFIGGIVGAFVAGAAGGLVYEGLPGGKLDESKERVLQGKKPYAIYTDTKRFRLSLSDFVGEDLQPISFPSDPSLSDHTIRINDEQIDLLLPFDGQNLQLVELNGNIPAFKFTLKTNRSQFDGSSVSTEGYIPFTALKDDNQPGRVDPGNIFTVTVTDNGELFHLGEKFKENIDIIDQPKLNLTAYPVSS